ncbi:enoyl-CoA hydratase/isomerase family protein [Qaidamihabitans albus]|uniref:enoyl-CoA hydratase/isomerase family protein n=1 Tax=Qaidamihabitans albus TaxID=2795733 RepID=UPI0018F1EEA6|nr:enoyl-CoA hydratase/isomerase family protein [Qaidamihabitans albus]
MTPGAPLSVERAEHGLTRIRFDRPGRRNAIDENTVAALLAELDHDPAGPVLLGSTDPAIFCAGADLDITDAERTRCSDLLYETYHRLVTRPGPVIAVVEGPAVGGGAQLATAADLRVAGPGCRFRWAGPGHGLAVGAWVLPDLVGRGIALELTLSGRWVGAAEALRIGLVNSVDDEPWPVAEKLVATVAGLDAAAVAGVKSITAAGGGLPDRLAAERHRNLRQWPGTVPR